MRSPGGALGLSGSGSWEGGEAEKRRVSSYLYMSQLLLRALCSTAALLLPRLDTCAAIHSMHPISCVLPARTFKCNPAGQRAASKPSVPGESFLLPAPPPLCAVPGYRREGSALLCSSAKVRGSRPGRDAPHSPPKRGAA